jgi:hypothetical protein
VLEFYALDFFGNTYDNLSVALLLEKKKAPEGSKIYPPVVSVIVIPTHVFSIAKFPSRLLPKRAYREDSPLAEDTLQVLRYFLKV